MTKYIDTKTKPSEPNKNRYPAEQPDIPFSSNAVRLSGRDWVIAAVIIAVAFCLIPGLWQRMEKFEPQPDYRIPYELSNDYWQYDRYCRWAAAKSETLVIGDSVMWGHYVSPDHTLSHYLNSIAGRDMFVNMGVDGIHPVALAGLLKYYGRGITDRKVLIGFNPLWMTSKKHDLQTQKEFRFNHPALAPQFIPKIPCYSESTSNKIGIIVEHNSRFLSWASHLKRTYFDDMPLPEWTMEHPYKNPLQAISMELPKPKDITKNEQTAWNAGGTLKQDFPWVELETSLQWKFFQRSLDTLQTRGNKVFVLVGPFNEHMMNEKSLEKYQQIKSGIENWLKQKNVPYYIPPVLPAKYYADASHPLSQGYAILAKQLWKNTAFSTTFSNPSGN